MERDWITLRGYLMSNPHCLQVLLQRCIEEPRRYLARIEWDTVAGHMQSFRGSEAYRRFIEVFSAHLEGHAEMVHFEDVVPPPAG